MNPDHPGFHDKEYKARRDIIANSTQGYKIGDPIPNADYDDKEIQLWSYAWNKLYPNIMKRGCAAYLKGFKKLEKLGLFRNDKIP